MKSLQGFILLCLLFLLSGCTGKAEGSTAAGNAAQPSSATDALQHLLEVEPRKGQGIIPDTLRIPAIGLNVPVEPVGVTESGHMGVPDSFESAGVLVPWTKPGEPGNAVIAGHVDHKTGPAVFYHLRKMKPGDRFYVSGGSGETAAFSVTSVEKYRTAEAPLARIFGQADTPHLNLITCTGKFNRKTREHSHRLVVFGEMVKQ